MAMKTILVVEDDSTMRDLLRLHLSNAGYAVRTAPNGLEAWNAITGLIPDLIITDVYMPQVNGFKFVQALRTRPALKDVPVIFLTVDADNSERGKALGAVEYLKKPIQLHVLLSTVAKHLPLTGA